MEELTCIFFREDKNCFTTVPTNACPPEKFQFIEQVAAEAKEEGEGEDEDEDEERESNIQAAENFNQSSRSGCS